MSDMNKPVILYFIRAEADLERIVSMSVPGKNYADQHFAYYGDISVIFEQGIKNTFQKYLLDSDGFKVLDVVTLFHVGKLYKAIKKIEAKNKVVRIIIELVLKILYKLIYIKQDKLANKLLKKIKPSFLITDNSEERENYFPHILRQVAKKKGVKVQVVTHGPAGGFHKDYYSYEPIKPQPYDQFNVGICSIYDIGFGMPNYTLTGDPSDSFPYVMYKNKLEYDEIIFLNERKYKIGFFMAAPFETCTNAWAIMEEIILDYAFCKDVAMVAKFHPRLYKFGEYPYLLKIDNLKLFGSELDRSRLVKWADIVVCSDHCSTLFEPMILGKKVVAVHTKKVRPFAKFKSPIHDCDPSMNSIHHSGEFNLDNLKAYTSDTSFIDTYCWGGLGKIDLGEKIIKELITNHD